MIVYQNVWELASTTFGKTNYSIKYIYQLKESSGINTLLKVFLLRNQKRINLRMRGATEDTKEGKTTDKISQPKTGYF